MLFKSPFSNNPQHLISVIKRATNLSNFDRSYVEEYCYTDQMKALNNRTNLYKLKSEIKDLELEIEKENQQICILTE